MSSTTSTNITLNNPKAVIVEKVELEKFDGSKKLEIKLLTASLMISSSIHFPTIFGRVIIGDSNNLLDNEAFAFTGEEFVNVTIKQPPQSNTVPQSDFSYKFVVNKVDTELQSEDTSGTVYRVELVSVDFFINSGAMKSRGYSNTNTNIVKSILENELKTETAVNNFEETLGTTQYAFVESKPFEKINMLTNQTFSNRDSITSTFLFYESFKGYNFESYENIVQRNLESETTPRKFSYKMSTSNDRQGYDSILSYFKPYRFNMHVRLAHGFYSTKVISYNLYEKRAEERTITLPNELKNVQNKLNSSHDLRSTDSFIEKVKDIGSLTYLIPYAPPNAYAPERVDNTNSSLLYSSPFSILLDESTISVRLNGILDQDISNLVELEFPDSLATTNTLKGIEKNLSGRYIISELTHEIQNTGGAFEIESSVTCIKESTLRRVTFYNSQLTTENINIKALQ
jgi:hypothetical protein